jgi:hypothetical protein
LAKDGGKSGDEDVAEESEEDVDIRVLEQEAAGSYEAPEVVSVDLADVVGIRGADQQVSML